MINVRKKKNIMMIIFLLMIFLVSNGITLAYLFAKTSPITSVFKPYDYLTGNLIISNQVEHPFGEDYMIPDNIEFEFQVDFGNYYANQTVTTSEGNYIIDENGIVELKIKPNSNVIINNIEEGTQVVVTEIQEDLGFKVKDNNVKNITISSTDESIIEFINVYEPTLVKAENIVLKGTKVLEGREWQEGDTFKFKLEYQDGNEWIELGTKTILYSIDNNEFNKFDFTDLIKTFEFNDAKTYKFRLSEIIGNLENITYDKTVNNFEIIIGDKLMDGELEIQNVKGYQNITVVKEEDNYNIEVTFNNAYEVEEETEIEYVDKVEESVLFDEKIVVKNDEYSIDTVLSKFEGLSNSYTYTIYDKDDVVQTSNLVRTGDYIKIKDNDKEYTYTMVLSGDVSGDGEINYLDYVKVYNHIQKVKYPESTKKELFDEYLLAADVSGEGKINYLDYVKIYNKIKESKGDAN